jgi:hypothetical protein
MASLFCSEGQTQSVSLLRKSERPSEKFYETFLRLRVARWHIFKPKIPIWLNFGGSCNGRCWYILWPLGIFYRNLVYICILWPFGILNDYLVIFPRFGILYKAKSGNPVVRPSVSIQMMIWASHLTKKTFLSFVIASAGAKIRRGAI